MGNILKASDCIKSKIVATYGPSCSSKEVMEKMVDSGVTCFRLNTAHSTFDELHSLVEFRNKIELEKNLHISIMVDLKGPELRALVKNDNLQMKSGGEYSLGEKGTGSEIEIGIKDVIKTLKNGDKILFMDGKIQSEVVSEGSSSCRIRALVSMALKNNGRMNIPGKYIPMGILQPRDMEYLDISVEKDVDYLALSFVQNSSEIDMVHDLIAGKGGRCKIISKIETKQALDNLDEIIKSSDALMVARGDLGVEMPIYEVILSQKAIMKKSHQYGVPTIVATQMLESMVNEDTPTRAEISDITNAILDNGDCLMLSEESAIGKFPLGAVNTLRDTSRYVEAQNTNFSEPEEFNGSRITYSISKSTRLLSEDVKSHYIIVLTKTGNTARMVSSVRPQNKIIAVTPDARTACQINIYKGVFPYLLKKPVEGITINQVLDSLLQDGIIEKGQRIVVVSGHPEHLFAGANQVSFLTVGDLVARGYVKGKGTTGIVNDSGGIYVGDYRNLGENEIGGSKFNAFILTGNVKRTILKEIEKSGKTCIYNTIILGKISPGDKLFIDCDVGAVYR